MNKINSFPTVDFHNEPMLGVTPVHVEYTTQRLHGGKLYCYFDPANLGKFGY